ncbi:MAG: elongation factor P [Clostridiales bacterium]|nr:elongation factor P [Clostridiales bacterium]
MISTNDFYSGATILVDGEPYLVLQSEHVKPGKGPAFVRAKLRNLRTGATVEKTFNAGEKIPRANVERSEMQFLYADGDDYIFMDNETFEQIAVPKEILGDDVQFLQENMDVKVIRFEGRVVDVELPPAVELTVVETDPGLRGDTAAGGSKPAKLEGGAVIQVPLFVRVGDRVRVDTRTRQYISRV